MERSRFFVGMATLLLVVVLGGFAPTFFLKIFFDRPELPWYLHLHGAAMTTWFALLLAQTALIASHRTALHRRLGILMAVFAPLLALTTFLLILNAKASQAARGITPPTSLEFVVLGDLGALIPFCILVAVGIFNRHRPALHKRTMLLASIAVVTPALARMARFEVLGPAGPVFLAAPLALMLALWVHDLRSHRRLHAATAWGSALLFGGFLASSILARTEAGKAFVAAISLPGG